METLTETLPVPLYSLDSKIMDTLCSHHSQEKIGSGTLPASNTLAVESPKFPPSSSVEPQSILTSLVPALLNTDSATSMMIVVDPTSVAPTTVTTRGPCQDNVPDTSDPLCIDLLGGEILPSQLNCFSADQESKKFIHWIFQLIRSPRSSIHWILLIKILWTCHFPALLWKMLTPVNYPCQMLWPSLLCHKSLISVM